MTTEHEARIKALEARLAVAEEALASVINMLRDESMDEDDVPAEDMEGNPLPRRRASEATL